ncbi:MAG TPA: PcfB family protein [Clostridia bacterium]|nr:PcfB family protein [Clostridia bacterium]
MLPEMDASSIAMQYVFKGGEVAIKVAGAAAKNLALLLIALLQQKNRTKGQVWVKTMTKQGTPLMTFPLSTEKLKEFAELAKGRGVMFAFIQDKDKAATHIDVLARQCDAALLKDIFGKLGLGELPVSGTIESSPLSEKDRIEGEKAGITTVYDHEVKELDTADRPQISGRINAQKVPALLTVFQSAKRLRHSPAKAKKRL